MKPPSAPETKSFSHFTIDQAAGITVFCSGPAESVDGVVALPLGHASLAPARSANATGEQLALVVRLRPQRSDGPNLLLAKGLDQFRLYQPDPERLRFAVRANERVELTVSLPADWYDTWHTVVAAYTGAALEVAIDGVRLGACPARGAIRHAPGTLFIGYDPFSAAKGNGAVASIALYHEIPEDWATLSPGHAADADVFVDFSDTARLNAEEQRDNVEVIEVAAGEASAAPQSGLDVSALPPLEIHEADNVGRFTGAGFQLEIDLPTATIVSWRIDGEELLELGPVHQFWRPPVFHELLPRHGEESIADQWGRAGYAENLMGTTAMEALQDSPHFVTLNFKGLIIRRNSDVLFEVRRTYTIYGHGEVLLDQTLTPAAPLPPMGRQGLEIRVPKRFCRAVRGTESDLGIPWAALRDRAGYGLMAFSNTPFASSVYPHSAFQRAEALYPALLTPDSANTWHLDQAFAAPPESAGTPLDTYGIPAAPHSMAIRLRGLRPGDDALARYAATGLPRH